MNRDLMTGDDWNSSQDDGETWEYACAACGKTGVVSLCEECAGKIRQRTAELEHATWVRPYEPCDRWEANYEDPFDE